MKVAVLSAFLSLSSKEASSMAEVVQVCLCVHFPLVNFIIRSSVDAVDCRSA